MHTTHWTWESQPFDVPWRDEPVTIGKKNQINNFCIGTQGNEKKCMTCHAGYGWSDANFDFSNSENVDCLACHADMATYAKGEYGNPAEGIDLLAAAQSVRTARRARTVANVTSMAAAATTSSTATWTKACISPRKTWTCTWASSISMCTDCHQPNDHVIKGKLLADNYTIDPEEQVACTDCHQGTDPRGRAHQHPYRLR